VAKLQHSKQFDQPLRIGPCLHTIDLKDLIVPPWGIGELAGQLEISTCVPEAVSLGDEAASFYRGEAVPFDKEEFFKKQIEECRELESQAVSAEDRAFWRQAVGRWEEQLRQAQRGKF
jgi:hypothetical protein